MKGRTKKISAPESVIRPAAFYECTKEARLRVGNAKHLDEMRAEIDDLVRKAGLTLFGSSIERYSDEEHHGYTYLAWIGESAIDIHTWPEYGSAIVNTHVCNLNRKNDVKIDRFFKAVRVFYGSKDPVDGGAIHLPLK